MKHVLGNLVPSAPKKASKKPIKMVDNTKVMQTIEVIRTSNDIITVRAAKLLRELGFVMVRKLTVSGVNQAYYSKSIPKSTVNDIVNRLSSLTCEPSFKIVRGK